MSLSALAKHFEECPPFPPDVPVADLPTISLERLEKDEGGGEAAKLFHACRNHGFFMLDLRESEQGRGLLANAGSMFDLTAETFSLPAETLDQHAYNPPKSVTGYKKPGIAKTGDGKMDTTGLYTIDRDDLRGIAPPFHHPKPIEETRARCRTFCERADDVIATVMASLDSQLGLPKDTLVKMCSPERPSASALRLLLSRPHNPAPKIAMAAHTDIGLITLLFHVAGGLQMLPAASENVDENWRFIRPQLGCVLMNIGDTLVEWTGGVLRSGLHRVVPVPGEQGALSRISIAYPVRPAHGESMRRLDGQGKVIPRVQNDQQYDDRTVDEWASERAAQILEGVLRPRTIGGAPTAVN